MLKCKDIYRGPLPKDMVRVTVRVRVSVRVRVRLRVRVRVWVRIRVGGYGLGFVEV